MHLQGISQMIQREIQSFSNLFFSVLKKYPESKRVFGVPETATSGTTDLINVKEVKVASDQLLDHYVDIGKSTGQNFDETMRKKADELNQQGVKAEYIKVGMDVFLRRNIHSNYVLFLVSDR